MTNALPAFISKKTLRKTLRAARLPSAQAIGTVIELRAVDARKLHILTSIQSLSWSPGQPLRLFVTAPEAGEGAAVLREIIPMRAAFGHGIRARFADAEGDPSGDFEMIVR